MALSTPGAISDSNTRAKRIPKVRLDLALSLILVVGGIEKAAGVVVEAVDDPILPLRLIVHGGALRVVIADAHPWRDEDAVSLVAHDL